jgi:two-component system chemotaxis sensor kinase CheA
MDTPSTPPVGRTIRVLVVDDSKVIRTFVRSGLTKNGWTVETAEGGHEALAKIPVFCPDVVICDLNMPEMEGSEVVARVAELDPNLPVVMHSDEAELTRVLKTVNLGAFDFIPKSKDLGPLIAAAQKAARHGWLARDNLRLTDELRDLNQALERRVSERTAELHTVNRDMRLVLDNVEQGFATLNRDGTLSAERSAVLDEWLGPYQPSKPLHAYVLDLTGADAAAWFQVTWDSLQESDLPLELSLEQMPKRMVAGGRSFALEFKPILVDGHWERMLFIMSDITAELERERAQRAQQDQLRAFEQIMRDRKAFLEFFAEANAIVERLQDAAVTDITEVRRLVHTLKGNCAQSGVSGVALLCHELENKMQSTGESLSASQRGSLAELWEPFARSVDVVAGRGGREIVEVPSRELRVALDRLQGGAESTEIFDQIRSWEFEPAERRLRRIGEQARTVAARLGKGVIEIEVEHNDVRLSSESWAQFWSSFTHAVRNAIDHGIETPEERLAAGKTENGRIRLATRIRGAELTVEISDDGRGVDWELVRKRARAASLPCETSADLHEALFHNGLSTKETVSEISGRGVGMAAIRAVCAKMGGRVVVESLLPGRGTTIRWTWPHTTELEVFRASRQPTPAAAPLC